MERDTRLEIGGSVGAIRGKICELHFKKVIESLGFKVIKFNQLTHIKAEEKICIHRYRMPPEKFTEIDFFFPKERVGIWISYIGRINRLKCTNPQCQHFGKKFNEFKFAKGVCPHCKSEILPLSFEGKLSWRCSKENRLVDPLDIINPVCTTCNSPLTFYEDTSASIQAHKQFYYRFTELLDVKTVSSDISCIFMSYSTKKEWRLWNKVFSFFFDDSLFLDDLPGVLDSNSFNNALTQKLKFWLKEKPLNEQQIWLDLLESKTLKRRNISCRLSNMLKRHFKRVLPLCFPIRYKIYEVLLEIKEKFKERWPKDIEEAYSKIIELIPNIYHDDTYPAELLTELLKRIKQRNEKFNWDKHKLIAKLDVEGLNKTPFKPGFEPLEELLFYVLEKLKEKGVIESYKNEPCVDVPMHTFLSGIEEIERDESTQARLLGEDAVIKLRNGIEVVVQCKTSASFKKFVENREILSSGISYKDVKRIIGHFTLEGYKVVEEKGIKRLKEDKNKIFVAIIDGNWSARQPFHLIKLMYLMGVDEIFYADELLDGTFENFLINLQK